VCGELLIYPESQFATHRQVQSLAGSALAHIEPRGRPKSTRGHRKVEPDHGVRIVASGAVDEELIDAVEMFLELQKKRLAAASKKGKDKAA
jgi:hypothetical protein